MTHTTTRTELGFVKLSDRERINIDVLPLRIACPTCYAKPGESCDKRGNLERGGPHHLTRGDRLLGGPWRGPFSKTTGPLAVRNWLIRTGRAASTDWLVEYTERLSRAAIEKQLADLVEQGLAEEVEDGWVWVDIKEVVEAQTRWESENRRRS